MDDVFTIPWPTQLPTNKRDKLGTIKQKQDRVPVHPMSNTGRDK